MWIHEEQKNVWIIVLIIVAAALAFILPNASKNNETEEKIVNNSLNADYTGNDFEEIYIEGGCFWGIEAYMERINGVIDATSGYANGTTEQPSYEEVVS